MCLFHPKGFICLSFEALYWPLPPLSQILLPFYISLGMAGALGDGWARGWKVPGVRPASSLVPLTGSGEACVCLLKMLECMGSVAHASWECATDLPPPGSQWSWGGQSL